MHPAQLARLVRQETIASPATSPAVAGTDEKQLYSVWILMHNTDLTILTVSLG